MLPLIDIDELLEEWKVVREIACPASDSMIDAITHECEKNKVDCAAFNVRDGRLNNLNNEEELACEFAEAYYNFTRTFIFRVLKS